jgi:hypothetical protein
MEFTKSSAIVGPLLAPLRPSDKLIFEDNENVSVIILPQPVTAVFALIQFTAALVSHAAFVSAANRRRSRPWPPALVPSTNPK